MLDQHQPSEGLSREYFTSLRENAGRQRERQTRARAVSFQMHRLFMPLDEEVSCRLTESGKMMLDIAHLIDRKCVERYLNKFSTTCAAMREYQMQLSGPWPPYHFVHRLTRGAASHRAASGAAPFRRHCWLAAAGGSTFRKRFPRWPETAALLRTAQKGHPARDGLF